MAIRIKLKTNREEWLRAWQEYPDRLRSAMARGMNRAGELVAKDAARRIAATGGDGFTSVFTGLLLRAMSAGWRVDPKTLTLRVGPGINPTRGPQSYAYFVEHGRRPGKKPPYRALELWARRKLGTPEEDLFPVVRSLQQLIARRGTVPSPFLGPAVRASIPAMRAAIERELDAEVHRINAE